MTGTTHLTAGVAVVAVDVPPGTPMGGFAGRLQPSSGVHDPTTVRALMVDGVGLVSVDVCALHEDTCRAIEEASGADAVVVSAVHTHGGPSIGCGRVGDHDPGVHDAVVDAAAAALRQAAASRRPVRLARTAVHGLGVAKDRRHLERVIDPPLAALRFADAATGTPVATLVTYPCHPVVLDATNTLVTADYVHPLRVRVEQQTGAPCVFLTGAAGDVNTGHSADVSFKAGKGAAPPQRTFERAAELGGRLGAGLVTATWTDLPTRGPARFTASPVALALDPPDPGELARRRAAWAESLPGADPGVAQVLRLWIDWADRWQPPAPGSAWHGRVGRLDLGGAASVVTLPGEPFLAAAETLQRLAPGTLVAGYCDGVPGYLPSAEAYDEGGYEVVDACMYYAMPAPFARGSLEQVVAAAGALLEA